MINHEKQEDMKQNLQNSQITTCKNRINKWWIEDVKKTQKMVKSSAEWQPVSYETIPHTHAHAQAEAVQCWNFTFCIGEKWLTYGWLWMGSESRTKERKIIEEEKRHSPAACSSRSRKGCEAQLLDVVSVRAGFSPRDQVSSSRGKPQFMYLPKPTWIGICIWSINQMSMTIAWHDFNIHPKLDDRSIRRKDENL